MDWQLGAHEAARRVYLRGLLGLLYLVKLIDQHSCYVSNADPLVTARPVSVLWLGKPILYSVFVCCCTA